MTNGRISKIIRDVLEELEDRLKDNEPEEVKHGLRQVKREWEKLRRERSS